MLGGINGVEGGSAAAGPQTGYNDDSINTLVNSGASGHIVDDAIITKLRDRLENHNLLGVLQKRLTAPGEAD